jgi:hypothetical protein
VQPIEPKLHDQQLHQLLPSLPHLQELRLLECHVSSSTFALFGQLRELHMLEVTAAEPLEAEHIHPLAELSSFRHLILHGAHMLRMTASVLHTIGQSSSWVIIELIGTAVACLPTPELDSSLVRDSYPRLKHLRVQLTADADTEVPLSVRRYQLGSICDVRESTVGSHEFACS